MTMLEQLRSNLKAALDKRAGHQATIDTIVAEAEARDDSSLTDDETRRFNEARDAIRGKPADSDDRGLDGDIDDLQNRIAEIDDLLTRKGDREKLAAELQPTPTPEGPGRQARVTKDEPTYRKGGRHSFFRDAYSVRYGGGDPDAGQRLGRHMNEVRLGDHGEIGTEVRDVGTPAFGALVVPSYLPEMYAEVLRAGRVTANLTFKPPMEDEGMAIVIPRGTTGTGVAAQSGENTAVQETDFDDTDLTIPLRTYSGQQDLSRQSVERGRNVDVLIYSDLAGAYSVSLNGDVINGAGTNGTHSGILVTSGVTTVSTTSTSVPAQLAKIAQAIGVVNAGRFMPASCIIMHPRRWSYFVAATDGQQRPLVVPEAGNPMNAPGVGDPAAYGFVGRIHGVPTYTDATIPSTISTHVSTGATEDRIIVAKASDLLLWEDDISPRQLRFEETLGGSLTIKLVVYGYSYFTAGWHPEGVCVVAGSGLTSPTFV